MSDRVNFSLTVSASNAQATARILEEHFPYDDFSDNPNGTVTYDFYEARGTGLEHADDLLAEAKIEWDLAWDQDQEWEAGVEYQRFSADGEIKRFEITESDRRLTLEQLLDYEQKGIPLIKVIEELREKIDVSPLHTQEL